MKDYIRVVKATNTAKPFVVQFSGDRIRWTDLEEFDSFEEALPYAKDLASRFEVLRPATIISHILWKSR